MRLFDREKATWLMNDEGVDLLLASSKHGVGRVVHEPPYLALGDKTVLEKGMSVTLEPHIMFSGDGDMFVGMEDHFIITNDGAEWLTKSAPMDLHV